jgi:cytidyltransferase-like protein
MSSGEKKVITFGVFDPLHEGHRNLFHQAGKEGDSLLVVIARDSWIQARKKREPFRNEEERLAIVKKQPFVSEAVLGYEWPAKDRYGLLGELDFDVVALGYDQDFSEREVEEELKKRGKGGVVVKRMKPFKSDVYKSSLLRCC